ncbi:hypothetical protein BDF21DRAFT_498533 [Thamnidium elegans]|nr:hypothetical protein BDF21DRAFT_498533 [Thamnidium elegans]
MPKVKTKTPKYNKRLLFRDDCFCMFDPNSSVLDLQKNLAFQTNKKRRDRRLAAKSSSAGNMEIQSKKSINTSPQRSTVTSDITGDFTLPTIPTIPIYSLLGDGFYENDDMDADWNDLPEFATEAEAVNTNEESSKKRSGREGVLNYTWNKYKDIIRNAYLTSINFGIESATSDNCNVATSNHACNTYKSKHWRSNVSLRDIKRMQMVAQVSIHAWVKFLNGRSLYYDINNKFKSISKVLLGDAFFIYSRMMLYLEEYKKNFLNIPSLSEECAAYLSIIVMDACFQLKRYKKKGEDTGLKPYPLSIEESMYRSEDDVLPYDQCTLSVLENGSFKVISDNRTANKNVIDENGVFSCSCGRHGSPYILTDVMKGKGKKYCLYSVNQINERLNQEINTSGIPPSPIDIMYDICCLTRKLLEKKYPFLNERGSRFAVNIFHAYAHIWECQIEYHPDYKQGWGLTDGGVGNRLAAKIQASILIAIKKARDYIRKYNSTLPDSNDPDAVRIPKEVVTQLQRDRTGALAEASGFSMNDGTTMWHAWCRSKEEVEIIKGEVFRTLKFADMYLDRLNEIVNGSDTYYDITRGAIEFIKLVDLPFARGWKRRTYDAVINDISDGGITMEDEENIIEGGDLESDDDKGPDVEEDLSLEETEDVL